MDSVPLEVNMGNFEGIYTDIEAELLKPEILSYAENTQWINSNKVAKRAGLLAKEWLGVDYRYPTNLLGLNQPEVLDYFKGQKRYGANIYEVLLLRDKAPSSASAPTGFLYIEITVAATGALVSSVLHAYNAGGSTRNQNPTIGKIRQYLNYIFIADGSTDAIFYINLTASEITTAITTLTLNATVNAALTTGDIYTDVDIQANKLFVSGSLGKVAHSNTLDPLNFTAVVPSNAGVIEYKATTGVVCKEITPSYLGLLISSENLALNEFTCDLMTGTVPFDITQAATQDRGFKVENLSNDVSFISHSIQAIDNNVIGLTQSGVIDLKTLVSAEKNDGVIRKENTLSYPIGDIMRDMNKVAASVCSCKDPVRKRYYLSVPSQDEENFTKYVYVYDYQYKEGIPRWSIWKLTIDGIGGLYTVGNEPFVADLFGNLFYLESGTTDNEENYYARIESAGVGGDTDFYEKEWPGISVTLKSSADNSAKNFRVYAIADEYYSVSNNYGQPTDAVALRADKKFSPVFNRRYRFDRARTFDDDGFGRELYFKKTDLPRSRVIRLVIEENRDEDLMYIPYWELTSMYVKGVISNDAVQAAY